jgi:MinD superfamily P-loop ATPase
MSALEATPPPVSADRKPTARQLVVLSGKGGTGKTSIVAALAAIVNDKVLADCDVDAADLHLVLDPQLRHREPFMSGKEARILPEHCSACGLCMDECRFDAIYLAQSDGGRSTYMVDPIACEGCGLCVRVCTSRAVEMRDAERGEWFVSQTRHGPLVHARLNIGGENSGKLVTLVRNQALTVAQESGAGLVLVDGPPGIGCPVIASVTGADLVLAVTEPTVSGAHDLERAADLVRSFGLPLAVCINKTDLNPEMAGRIREVCAVRGFPVVGELSYDLAVVRAQVEGKSIVEYDSSVVADQIREMWESVDTMLREVKKAEA